MHKVTENCAHAAVKLDETNPSEASPFIKEQLEALQKVISQASSSSTALPNQPTSIIAHRGNVSLNLHTKIRKIKPWIVDSGTSDHMTGDIRISAIFTEITKPQQCAWKMVLF